MLQVAMSPSGLERRSALLILTLITFTGALPSAQARIAKFDTVEAGMLYRGAQPSKSNDYDELYALGVRTVINLRTMKENSHQKEKAEAEKRGMAFIHIPMADWHTPSEETMKGIYSVLLEMKRDRNGGQSAIPLPAFVHCKAGRNRTGFFSFLYRVSVQGWDFSEAKEDLWDHGFVKRRYKYAGPKNRLLNFINNRDFQPYEDELNRILAEGPTAPSAVDEAVEEWLRQQEQKLLNSRPRSPSKPVRDDEPRFRGRSRGSDAPAPRR